MNWIELTSLAQLDEIKKLSENQPVLIFKHSTRCSTSRMSLDRLERNWENAGMSSVKPFFLDLLSYRQISNEIAEEFGIQHESPQVIVISNGQPVLDLSHFDIDCERIKQAVKS